VRSSTARRQGNAGYWRGSTPKRNPQWSGLEEQVSSEETLLLKTWHTVIGKNKSAHKLRVRLGCLSLAMCLLTPVPNTFQILEVGWEVGSEQAQHCERMAYFAFPLPCELLVFGRKN